MGMVKADTTPAEEILTFILDNVAQGKRVAFSEDWGGEGSLTVEIDGAHTHCGVPNGKRQDLIRSLASTVTGKGGLSWA